MGQVGLLRGRILRFVVPGCKAADVSEFVKT